MTPEQKREWDREYYRKNRERILERNRELKRREQKRARYELIRQDPEWVERKRQQERERQRVLRERNPEQVREYQRQWKYGLTPETRAEILTRQGGTCALSWCQKDDHGKRPLSTDHDHETKEIRGLLCSWHNTMLGAIGDGRDHDRLNEILSYLGYAPTFKVGAE